MSIGQKISSNFPILSVDSLSVGLRGKGFSYDIVRKVNFDLYPNEILSIVGESGCGKTLTALAVLGLQSPPLHITSGHVRYGQYDLIKMSGRDLRKIRGAEISMIFQDPMTSLDPMFTVGQLLLAAIGSHRTLTKSAATEVGLQALADAGLGDPRKRFDSYSFQLSGGVAQRAMIALALVNNPKVIIADEPTTALDVTVQAQILEKLKDLQSSRGMSIILITHNLGVVASVSDRLAVMYSGEIVETGKVEDVFQNPHHPYTRGLLAAVPRLHGKVSELQPIRGRVPLPDALPPGCTFSDRCERAIEKCMIQHPELEQIGSVAVRCFNPHP